MDSCAEAPSAGLATADDGAYDHLRRRVFLAFVRTTAGFSVLMTIAEGVVRGAFAWQTIAFALIAAVFAAFSLLLPPTGDTKVPTIVALSIYTLAFAAIETTSPVPTAGIRVASFAFPVAAVLLAGRRPAVYFYLAAVVQALVLLELDGTPRENGLLVLHAVGSIFVGAILLAMAWAFDAARRSAMKLASERERALRVALERAEAAAEARARFLGNMSHEIRTPMNGVLGLSRLLAEESVSESQRELAETVVCSGESLLQILDDILDLSKLDAGALLIDPRPEQPERIARQVLALMKVRAEEGGIALRLEVDQAVPPWVRLDGHRLRQVLTNLVGNAVKFTQGGEVKVRVTHTNEVLRCEIVDTGIGIEPAKQEALFQPFIQADSSTARRFGGTGLGLAICKRLCGLMGGSIGVESALGEGSTFWFELPAERVAAPEEAEAKTGGDLSQLRVLVAEDNKINQLVIRRLLQRFEIEPRIVTDGADVVREVQRQPYDLVLMDWHMPGVDGLEATRRIRRLEGAPSRTPVVALTASVMSGDRAACLDAGMDEVLPKPVDVQRLKDTLLFHAAASGPPSVSSASPESRVA